MMLYKVLLSSLLPSLPLVLAQSDADIPYTTVTPW
jgi:hypothetical protein